MNKIIAIVIVSAVIVGGGSFYAGMKYDQSKNKTERQTRMQQFGGGNGGPRGQQRAAGGGFASGEIISKDDKSVTVKLQDGGSKIVFVSDSTAVMKSTQGSLGDVLVGGQVMATGSPNPDGSISAQSIQIRLAPPVVSQSSAGQSDNVKEFTITGNNYSFLPANFAVKKGDKVRVVFKNVEGFHDFKIDEFNVATKKISAGAEDAVEFTADKTGSFEFYCSIGDHRAMGMKGILTVE